MNYEEKYKKYKNKYIKLRNQIGGVPEDELKKEIDNCDKKATKNIYDHRECPLCPFNNTGENTKSNKCQPITGNVDKCFYNFSKSLSSNRMKISKYIENIGTFTLENNINVTNPEGEICFGNTITSCLTYCIILEDNRKISVHINPITNYDSNLRNNNYKKTEVEDSDIILESGISLHKSNIGKKKKIISNELVNVFNVKKKILEKLNVYKKNIKKIILLGADKYSIYKNIFGKYFIGPDNLFEHYNKSISLIKDQTPKSLLEKYFKTYITPKTKYLEKFSIDIQSGSIYIIKANGDGFIYNRDDSIKETF